MTEQERKANIISRNHGKLQVKRATDGYFHFTSNGNETYECYSSGEIMPSETTFDLQKELGKIQTFFENELKNKRVCNFSYSCISETNDSMPNELLKQFEV